MRLHNDAWAPPCISSVFLGLFFRPPQRPGPAQVWQPLRVPGGWGAWVASLREHGSRCTPVTMAARRI